MVRENGANLAPVKFLPIGPTIIKQCRYHLESAIDYWTSDDDKRHALWRELHRYLYENVQPYLYRDAPPRKFALSQKLRGVQFFKLTPGYALRRWYYPAGLEKK